jgi:hypothetical protein
MKPLDYSWVKTSSEMQAYCVYIGVGVSQEQVGKSYGIIPETHCLKNASSMWGIGQTSDGNDVMRLGELGDAVVAFENNGWTGIAESVVHAINAPLSVSIYRDVNSHSTFIYAKQGKIIRSFDPVIYNPEGAIPEEERFGFEPPRDDPNWGAHNEEFAFQLMEILTGIALSREWLLDELLPTYRHNSPA